MDTDPKAELSRRVIPLSGPFRSPPGLYDLFGAGARTGTHEVRYQPKVRGKYRLDVQLPAIPEVQVLETFVDPGAHLSGNFSLRFAGVDELTLEPREFEETRSMPCAVGRGYGRGPGGAPNVESAEAERTARTQRSSAAVTFRRTLSPPHRVRPPAPP